MTDIPKFADASEAASLLALLGDEFAVVRNPSYVHPPYEFYPLAPKRTLLERGLAGVVMDMDGTTTTTEPLCLHSLETMVARLCGHAGDAGWPGLNRERDYPHIIGNSTTKHVEYLVDTYGSGIDEVAFKRAFLHAAAWTLTHGRDEGRRRDAENSAAALGVPDAVRHPRFAEAATDEPGGNALDELERTFASLLRLDSFENRVRAAVDIYYQRYHYILGLLAQGRPDDVNHLVQEPGHANVIEPMPGVGVFLAMLKGWLDADAGKLAPVAAGETGRAMAESRLAALGRHFAQQPARIAVVTSSIAYEAGIVLGEVFRVLREEAASWPVSAECRERVLAGFEAPGTCYDGIVTASDSSEIRLKPHRDLYSIALHQLGIGREDFGKVAGFEDSESGTIAIRAAGIGCCCAVPFAQTAGHGFQAASVVANGGIPEVLLERNVFLPEDAAE